MKSIPVLFALLCFAVACKKNAITSNPAPKPQPVMRITDLLDSNIVW
jgi:hypothetical protein